jgi:hypothetical protein
MVRATEFNDKSEFARWVEENINFNSMYDKSYLISVIDSIQKLEFVRVKNIEFCDAVVTQNVFVYRNHTDHSNFFIVYITTYNDDGLAYITNGSVYCNDEHNKLILYPPSKKLNFDYLTCFKFIRMYDDVPIPNTSFGHDILQIVGQEIVNYLSNMGFACQSETFAGCTDITIPVGDVQIASEISNFLFNLNWTDCLKDVDNIISTVEIKLRSNSKVRKIRLSSDMSILNIEIVSNNSVTLRLWLANPTVVDLFNNNRTEVYDGWELAPQLKHIYTNPKWTIKPVKSFKVFGLKQVFDVNSKYLPLHDLNIMRVDGFEINGVQYFFGSPQYVEIPFRPLNSALWNKWVLTNGW